MSFELITLDADSGAVAFNVHPDPLVMRERIMAVKDKLLSVPGEHVEMPVEHFFLNGMYTRKLFIPKGTVLVGKIHTKDCVNIVAKGDISVVTESGSMRVQAGFTLLSPAGIQKLGYAHEDTIFINVFRTDETDIDKIEADISCESYEALTGLVFEHKEALCL